MALNYRYHALGIFMSRNLVCLLVASLLSATSIQAPATTLAQTLASPYVRARNYVLIDPRSGQALISQAANQPVPPASLTKLMTAYLTFMALKQGQLKLDQQASVSVDAWKAGGSTMFLQPGLPVTIDQLVQGLVVVSGNDAAIVLAQTIAGNTSSFVQLMNLTAKRLGMNQSHFDSVNGLPTPTHLISAGDIALLTRNIMQQFPQYLHYFGEHTFTYNKVTQPNWNPLVFTDSTITGMKTGHTNEAGYCLVATATRMGRSLISVVLGSQTRGDSANAAEALLDFGYRFFETRRVYQAGQRISTITNTWSSPSQILIGITDDVWVTFPVGHYASIKAKVDIPANIKLPITKGQFLGSLILIDGEEVLSRTPLVVLNPVQKANWLKHLWNVIKTAI
jgi:D-alanyl-D-alanine carboxypeptidase (penicillin-binding protein 5/6)